MAFFIWTKRFLRALRVKMVTYESCLIEDTARDNQPTLVIVIRIIPYKSCVPKKVTYVV